MLVYYVKTGQGTRWVIKICPTSHPNLPNILYKTLTTSDKTLSNDKMNNCKSILSEMYVFPVSHARNPIQYVTDPRNLPLFKNLLKVLKEKSKKRGKMF